MIFFHEWILAVHKAIWFPVLWMTGLEATPIDTGRRYALEAAGARAGGEEYHSGTIPRPPGRKDGKVGLNAS